MTKVVEQPRPIDIEQHTPINVQRPIQYTEKVNIPIDEKGSESSLNTNVNNINDANSVQNTESTNGLQHLSAGYEPHKIQKKA